MHASAWPSCARRPPRRPPLHGDGLPRAPSQSAWDGHASWWHVAKPRKARLGSALETAFTPRPGLPVSRLVGRVPQAASPGGGQGPAASLGRRRARRARACDATPVIFRACVMAQPGPSQLAQVYDAYEAT